MGKLSVSDDVPVHLGDEIEVFATGDTTAFVADEHAISDLVRRGAGSVRDGFEHVRDLHATPGHRPGLRVPSTSARRGGGTDIVQPVPVSPLVAADLTTSGAVFRQPMRALEIDCDVVGADRYLVWPACVVDTTGERTLASLHLLASPSMVVTVLELVPLRTLRRGRDRFVRAGIAALEELAARLVAAA